MVSQAQRTAMLMLALLAGIALGWLVHDRPEAQQITSMILTWIVGIAFGWFLRDRRGDRL